MLRGAEAPFSASAVIGGVVAESGQNWPCVNHDRDDGAGRQNEGDGRKSNELVHNLIQSKIVAGTNIPARPVEKREPNHTMERIMR
jgi:hypothetical protein